MYHSKHNNKHTRRDVLKTGAALTAAGMAMPYFFTGAVAGEPNGHRPTIASIGVGGRGSDIGRQAARFGNMVACADVHQGNADKFAADFDGKCRVYRDYRQVLDRNDVEAVTIGTPDHWHVKIAIDAMKAGKDVYCEKPLTLTIDESQLVCKVAKETDRVFQVGTQQRSEFRGAFLEAVAIARSGRLGDKLKARASMGPGKTGGPFKTQKPPKELDWDFWLGQTPKVPFCQNRCVYFFRYWFEYSGGMVTDWGVHHTDIALWALGGEHTGPIEVEGKGDFPLGRELVLGYLLGKKSAADLPNSYNTVRSFDCTMHLPNGNVIRLNSRQNNRDGNGVFITGDKGEVIVNRRGIGGKFVEELKRSPADKQWLEEEVSKLYGGKPIRPVRGHMANFFDCVKDRSQPISDVFTHCNSANACHMANIAMLLGRKMRWDSRNQEFIGDDEANRLTCRKQREPYGIQA